MSVRNCLLGMMLATFAAGCSGSSSPMDAGITKKGLTTTIPLPGGGAGIDFGDWYYSTTLHKVVVPGANTGSLYLIDPMSLAVSTVTGFPMPVNPDGGIVFHLPDGFMVPDGFHIPDGGFRGFEFGGLQSVAEANGLLYTVNATDNNLYYVDPVALAIKGKVALKGQPFTIRYSSSTKELWVIERIGMGFTGQIEVITFGPDNQTPVTPGTAISFNAGGTAMYIDNTHMQAYVLGLGPGGLEAGMAPILEIGLTTRTVTNNMGWTIPCRAAGFSADEPNGLLFIACRDNGAVSFSVTTASVVQHFENASQPEILGWNATLRHLYVPGPSTFIMSVSSTGSLTSNGGVPTPYAESAALADEYGNFWNQQNYNGAVLRTNDPVTN